MMVQRVSNAGAQGTRWGATPNAHQRKDQTFEISANREEGTSPGRLIFTAVKRLSFTALQTGCVCAIPCFFPWNREFSRRRPVRGRLADPPPSPYVWATRSKIPEIARACGVICPSDGSGETVFRAVRRQQAGNISAGNFGRVRFGSLKERIDSRIHVVSWYAAIAFLND
jgi:hypothetical protein